MKIIVPATSANIGAGFDSIGLAVNLYLSVEVGQETEKWVIEHDLGEEIPNNEENLLLQTALYVSPSLKPHHLIMTSDIPLARGLGSSSSVIVAGIELANQLGELQLTTDEKRDIAAALEGHPDNIAPAIYGDLVVSVSTPAENLSIKANFPKADLLAFVPAYQLKTSDSRAVLPSEFFYKEAVIASSIANVLVAALLSGDLEKAGKMIEADRFHEIYRQGLVTEFPRLRALGHEYGAYATYLSGAGPTVMMLLPEGTSEHLAQAIAREEGLEGELIHLKVDKRGIVIEN